MGTRLLLADDSITIQKVVGIIFANEDYDLTVVDNGVAALDKAREAIPDLMLVDALMPGRNGYEVCQEVRADARLKNVPLLLMTGAFEPFDEGKAEQCGADDFISKPFESQQFLDKVKRLLELGKERAAASVAEMPSAIYTQPESLFVPPSTPWGESPPSVAAPFEPIPEMFDDTLQANEAVFVDDFSATVADESTGMAVEVVEAGPGDDPWGVFDLTDLDEEIAPVSSGQPLENIYGSITEAGAFSPDDLEPGVVEGIEPAAPVFTVDAGQIDPGFEPLAEESYTYQIEELTPAGETFTVGMGEPLAVLTDNPSQYEEITAESFESKVDPEISSPDLYVSQIEAESDIFVSHSSPLEPAAMYTGAPLPEAADLSAEPAPVVAPQPAFGEEQLRAILSQLSREVIEKIVWEVVPDLAETIIREEIRKLKEGIVR